MTFRFEKDDIKIVYGTVKGFNLKGMCQVYLVTAQDLYLLKDPCQFKYTITEPVLLMLSNNVLC